MKGVAALSKQVIWSKIILETYIREGNLSKEDEWIMRTRVAGWSRTKQATHLHISLSSLDKRIAYLKKLYDQVHGLTSYSGDFFQVGHFRRRKTAPLATG